MGLDLSINGTGWYKEFGKVGSAYGTILHPRALKHPEYTLDRLFIIARELRDLVADCHMVGIEALAMGAKGRATKDLAGLSWIVRLICFDLGVDYCTPNPQAVKLYAAGKGNASKQEVAQGVKDKWGQQFQNNDQTDAFAICQIAKGVIKRPRNLSESQERGLRRQQHLREVRSRRDSRAKLTSTSEIYTLAGGGSVSMRIERELTTGPSGPIVQGLVSGSAPSTSKSDRSRKKKVSHS